ncbi:hypothetical protein QFC22_002832 [Naganishia vaughanmartiniae]|uniref:Uncharacterized protein n=1 Tax=Naganishia vaughanmartiniae TaxID=1424756 RepID=A0ACC2XC84_9TREE|nr:hypothetical protein QFC22_002832 [Naganishia vaughanmartiniae]
MDFRQALPFILGAVAAGLMGTLLGPQVSLLASDSRAPLAPSADSQSNQKANSSNPPSLSQTPSQLPPSAVSPVKASSENAVITTTSPISPSSKNCVFTDIHEVYDPRRGWIVAPPMESADRRDTNGRAFVIHFREAPSGRSAENSIWLEIENGALLDKLREHFPTAVGLYDNKPGIDGREVYLKRHALQTDLMSYSTSLKGIFTAMLTVVEEEFNVIQANRAVLPEHTIIWPYLWCLFENGSDIETKDDVTDECQALVLDSWNYTIDARGRTFAAKCHFYQWTGSAFYRMYKVLKIPEFKDIQEISSLKFWPLEEEKKSRYQERGSRYTQYAGLTHADYTGSLYTRLFSGVNRLPGDGRVMIDVRGYRKANPTQDIWPDDNNRVDDPPKSQRGDFAVPVKTLEGNLHYLLPASIHGFSFTLKRWGELLIDRLSSVKWNPLAFDRLVIPQDYRRTIEALVDVHSGKLKGGLIQDVVKGKGDGLIIALHGTPGTGKTLTAEAVSEHLKRPLYTISAGELGTTIVNLERKLQDTLELATSWKAVLLIDEADIFLEKRSTANIERNAMVGIFLKLLEYFSGVLILTTNRLSEFDEAFESRFSVTLSFNGLSKDSRRELWCQFLQLASTKGDAPISESFDLDKLAEVELNGRMIRQAVRTAQALAAATQEPLRMDHLASVIRLLRPADTTFQEE